MFWNWFFGALASLSFVLLLWQWLAARRFPLHQRSAEHQLGSPDGKTLGHNPARQPPVTLLKPLKGCDAATEDCLRSWLAQDYAGETQVLFGVEAADDPACEVVRRLLGEFPQRDAQLIVCGPLIGTNAKVSKLAELERFAKHELFVISDADVRAPADLLANAVAPLADTAGSHPPVGLVSCFYRLANPVTLAMQWEAVAVNADFWSQVLQARTLQPLDFALGAVMVVPRRRLEEFGGFRALANYIADDYQLGNRLTSRGHRIGLCPVVAECWDPPMNWRAVWKHQLRWARTIRVCKPVPYFFSLLANVTLWSLLWFVAAWPALTWKTWHLFSAGAVQVSFSKTVVPSGVVLPIVFCLLRVAITFDLQRRLTGSAGAAKFAWMAPLKDLLQAAVWLGAFTGDRIEWRGRRFRLRRDGTLAES